MKVDDSIGGVIMLQIIIIIKILKVRIIILIICNSNDNNATIEVSNAISSVRVMTILYFFRHSDWWRQSSFARRLIMGKRRLGQNIRDDPPNIRANKD